MTAPAKGERRYHFARPRIPNLVLNWRKNALMIIFALLAARLFVPLLADLDDSWDVIADMRWPWVVAAILLQTVSFLGSGVLLKGLVRVGGGDISVLRGTAVTLASKAVGMVAAGIVGATASTYAWCQDGGGNREGAGLAATLKPVFNNGVLLLASVYGCTHLFIRHELTGAEAIGFASTLGLLLTLGSLAWYFTKNPKAIDAPLNKVFALLAKIRRKSYDPDAHSFRVERNINRMRNTGQALRSGGWRMPTAGAIINVAFDALTVLALFRATNSDIGLGVMFTGYSVALLIGKAAVVPGGIGVVEATMASIYTQLGQPEVIVLSVVIAFRILSLWIPVLLGIPAAFGLQRGRGRLREIKGSYPGLTTPTTSGQ